jgi:hypothetical protein
MLKFSLLSGAAVWTEQDDEEIEYGEWKEFTAKETLVEERKVHPAKAIEGIPSGYLLAVASKTGERR